MPFTFAHPAAVLPVLNLRREAGWKAALVAGTLTPDLLRPLFSFHREITHSLWGWLLLDTPAAILLGWLIHRFLVPRLRRLPGLAASDPKSSAVRFVLWTAIAGAAAGGLTHLGWDLFTHDQSPFTRGGILDRELFLTPAGPFLVGQTLWYLNSALGLAALVGWALVKLHRTPGGLRILLSWSWARLVLLPALPFSFLLLGFHRESGHLSKDLFIHVAYLSNGLAPRLLIPSVCTALAVFLWETRRRAPN